MEKYAQQIKNNINNQINIWKHINHTKQNTYLQTTPHKRRRAAAEGCRPPLSILVCFANIYCLLYDLYIFDIFTSLFVIFLFALYIFFNLHGKLWKVMKQDAHTKIVEIRLKSSSSTSLNLHNIQEGVF